MLNQWRKEKFTPRIYQCQNLGLLIQPLHSSTPRALCKGSRQQSFKSLRPLNISPKYNSCPKQIIKETTISVYSVFIQHYRQIVSIVEKTCCNKIYPALATLENDFILFCHTVHVAR